MSEAAADDAIGIGHDISALGLGIEGVLELSFIYLAAYMFGIFVDITGFLDESLAVVDAEVFHGVFSEVTFPVFIAVIGVFIMADTF